MPRASKKRATKKKSVKRRPAIKPIDTDVTPYISEEPAAEHLGLSIHTMRGYRRQGIGPKYTKFGAAVRYTYEWLDEFAQSRIVEPTA